MCGYAGAITAGADIWAQSEEAHHARKLAGWERESAERAVNQKREEAGRAAARNEAKLQIRREQERSATSKKKQNILKKQLQEEAESIVTAEARGISSDSASIEAFQGQLTRANLNAIEAVSNDFNSLKNHIAMMSADNWKNLESTRTSLNNAMDDIKDREKAKIPDMTLVRLGQFSSLMRGYITDKELGEGGKDGVEQDTWGLGKGWNATKEWYQSLQIKK